ncbi:4-alpha-D-glucan glucanohydrolase) [Durusdinium trenchii]|uniref:Alpha-amylase n=1 Tax=Durusdinium trenchii TaxID=1381693 RepID=A0ABP0Q8H8_9DINO
MGFDAVQISPAQKSKHGHEWWARYQPQDYGKIEGLGSWEELKELCRRADELKLRVIGDVVFNHMLVVGSCHEWRQAQANPARLKQLQERLVRETSMRLEDFQWPWFEMSGEHWDNENRYEGWGSGEWSELRYCERVVAAQQKHLRLLLDAGVRGIRFDAVKHLRPAHLEEHLQLLRKEKVFAYGEVLPPGCNARGVHGAVVSIHRLPFDSLHVPGPVGGHRGRPGGCLGCCCARGQGDRSEECEAFPDLRALGGLGPLCTESRHGDESGALLRPGWLLCGGHGFVGLAFGFARWQRLGLP